MKSSFCIIVFLLLPTFSKALTANFTVVAITPMQYQVPGTKMFSVTIGQIGSVTFSTANIYWQLDGGTINVVTKTPFELYWQNVKTAWVNDTAFKVVLASTGKHKLKAWIKTIYPIDGDHTNDTLIQDIDVFSTLPKKNVLMEVYNRQDFWPSYVYSKYNDTVVGVDPDYTIINCYNIPGQSLYYPDTDAHITLSNTFDRYKFPFLDHLDVEYNTDTGATLRILSLEALGQREQFYEPVEIFFRSINYNSTTRELKATVAAKFFDSLSGDYRLNIFLTENGIADSQAGAPTPGTYIHNNVLRARLGGYWGKAGSIPTSVTAGSIWDYQFTYTVPASYNFDSLKIIGLLQKYSTDKNDRRILNSTQNNLKNALSIDKKIVDERNVEIYPNPSNGEFTIRFNNAAFKNGQISVYDMMGNEIYRSAITNSWIQLNLSNTTKGTYLAKLQLDNIVVTKLITIE